MATPILNIVPSYSVDNGVVLNFDSNYGTNLLRGSSVTIYDQNLNFIATHFYIPSTYNEASSQHVIPSKQALLNESVMPNAYESTINYPIDAIVTYSGATYKCIQPAYNVPPTDPSYWVRLIDAEAKLSYIAIDFEDKYVDETQLQFVVNVFVNYEVDSYTGDITPIGESSPSNTKSAWALPIPTITFDTIPSAIDTTSYTIGFTYYTNQTISSGLVYNPPQNVEFVLYRLINGEWEVVSDDNIYNSGILIGDNEHYINYPFYSLSNGATYKVEVIIQSLLGMIVTSTTNEFVVDAVTYQISTFSVNNDSCNGKVDITSNITDIKGESNQTPQGGAINLTGVGDYCSWADGLAFTNNWTMRLWGYDFNVADSIDAEQAIVHIASDSTNGIIDGYIIETQGGYRFDLYVYPTGYDGVVSYFQSNVVATLGNENNPLCIVIGFDYDVSGTYYVNIR